MKKIALLIGSVVLLTGLEAFAGGRCRVGQAHPRRVVYRTAPATCYAPVATYAPQMYYAPPVVSPQSTPTAAVATPMPAEVARPNYNYLASNREVPAYYYSYDNSGKLIVSQWVDWLFRGGRAEGMPRPPLPIIGNLRNGDR